MKVKKEKFFHASIDKVLVKRSPHNLKDLVALNFISLSKDFHINSFGDFGLSDWSEINPKPSGLGLYGS